LSQHQKDHRCSGRIDEERMAGSRSTLRLRAASRRGIPVPKSPESSPSGRSAKCALGPCDPTPATIFIARVIFCVDLTLEMRWANGFE